MPDLIGLWIPGDPKGKQRPRVLKTGRSYTPKQTVEYENLIKAEYHRKYKMWCFEKSIPLYINIEATYKIPAALKKTFKPGLYKPTKKPDADNIAKIVMDALNGVAYHDDAQITVLRVLKKYGDEAGVFIQIGEVKS